MGLFSTDKNKAESGFDFLIRETFLLRGNGSVVVTGNLKKGRFVPGTDAVCVTEDGAPVFACRIDGIEQGRRVVRIASLDGVDAKGSEYGLKLSGANALNIPDHAHLVAASAPLLQALEEAGLSAMPDEKASDEEPAGQGEEGEYPVGPLGEEREEELAALAKNGKLDSKAFERLDIQESIYTLLALERANRKEPLPDYKERGDYIYRSVLKKLKEADDLFVLIDRGSSVPFMLGEVTEIYSARYMAQKAADFYAGQYHRLEVMEVTRKHSPLPSGLGLFEWLDLLGRNILLVDNGSYQLRLKLKDVLPAVRVVRGEGEAVPVRNPRLRFEMAVLLEEARWRVSYPEREDNLAMKEKRVFNELVKAVFLVPAKVNGASIRYGENTLKRGEFSSMHIPKLENNKGQRFIPVFTDWSEFSLGYDPRRWAAVTMSLKDVIALAGADPVSINPLRENLILKEETLKELKERIEKMESVLPKNHAL